MRLLWVYAVMMGAQFFCGLGMPPLPEEVVVVGAGVTTKKLNLSPWLGWPACIVGILLADLVLYGVGRFGRNRLFRYGWMNRFLPPDRRERIEQGFGTHGVKIMMTSRLLPGVRTGVFIMAGAVRYPFVRFLIADAVFLVFGVGLFYFGGYSFTHAIQNLVDGVHQVQHLVIIVLIPLVAGYLLYCYFRYWRSGTRGEEELDPAHLLHIGKHAKPDQKAQSQAQAHSPSPSRD